MDWVRYLAELWRKEQELCDTLGAIAGRHGDEPDVSGMCKLLAAWSEAHVMLLAGWLGTGSSGGVIAEADGSGVGARWMHEFQHAWLTVADVHVRWAVVHQTAAATHDAALLKLSIAALGHSQRQMAWLLARLKEAAPAQWMDAA